MKPEKLQKLVLNWYDNFGRKDLPWQQNMDDYSVWISEIMLQQTQVATVIPFYNRFMKRFPNVSALAAAQIDEVLHYWTGLGYYARARNLHTTAVLVKNLHNGVFPSGLEDLIALPGIGRSTAGAIRSIAFKKPAAILDGNVKRVLARYAAIQGWPGHAEPAEKLWALAEKMSPSRRTDDYSQAMMDLGATVCMRKPKCHACPIKAGCQAFKSGNVLDYPGKKIKKFLPVKECCFLIILNENNEILLRRNPDSGVWGGLWMFPECENRNQAQEICKKLGIEIVNQDAIPMMQHTFSHFRLNYHPIKINGTISDNRSTHDPVGQLWYDLENPKELGIPAPAKKVFDILRG